MVCLRPRPGCGKLPRGGGPLRLAWHVGLLAFVACALAGTAKAQEMLPCGVPVVHYLSAGAGHAFQLDLVSAATTIIEVTDTDGTIGLVKLRVAGQGLETCSGALTLPGPGSFVVEVSDCVGADAGNYVVTQNVVSAGVDNCGFQLACGATPDGVALTVPGQVDAYAFTGTLGSQVGLRIRDLTGALGLLRGRVFAPDGTLLSGADSCAGSLNVTLPATGQYTALVSPCSDPRTGPYRLTFQAPHCPAGPLITHFGLARADEFTFGPMDLDSQGRPIFFGGLGSGFRMVIEARPGTDGRTPGENAFNSDTSDPTQLPDLQVLVSRPLGNGSAVVCDKTPPGAGGVPGISPPHFATAQAVADAVNDLGCRFDDGTGQPRARTSQLDACTRSDQDFGYGFVDPSTTVQFCALIDSNSPFPPGDTVVAARVRDDTGTLGAVREIVVRVEAGCVGNCDGGDFVTVDEILHCVSLALGDGPLTLCPRCDASGDGTVTIDEVLQAVNNALNGCG